MIKGISQLRIKAYFFEKKRIKVLAGFRNARTFAAALNARRD
jgi:hypothetical protein